MHDNANGRLRCLRFWAGMGCVALAALLWSVFLFCDAGSQGVAVSRILFFLSLATAGDGFIILKGEPWAEVGAIVGLQAVVIGASPIIFWLAGCS